MSADPDKHRPDPSRADGADGVGSDDPADPADPADSDDPADSADTDDTDDTDGTDAPDLAHALLARTRGEHLPPGTYRRRRPVGGRRRGGAESRREGWSGARPDALDPVRVGSVLEGFVAARGWDDTMAQARVLSDWAAIVGPDVAAHCTPVSLTAGDLRLSAETTAWATQLRMLTQTMITRIDEQVGRDVVRRITVTGPVAPSWQHGPRSVRGARGPRDTYG